MKLSLNNFSLFSHKLKHFAFIWKLNRLLPELTYLFQYKGTVITLSNKTRQVNQLVLINKRIFGSLIYYKSNYHYFYSIIKGLQTIRKIHTHSFIIQSVSALSLVPLNFILLQLTHLPPPQDWGTRLETSYWPKRCRFTLHPIIWANYILTLLGFAELFVRYSTFWINCR